ncbi:predicted protein [Chaetoceros tenuissimus]|uniref:Uncharacterized protein n=1 Tax=Chaetoceros tenuissimus TaxID=426638 RepID=A0AAD3H709_9STRA|nr:predicted protein [Chaetoceros tenuissimus]
MIDAETLRYYCENQRWEVILNHLISSDVSADEKKINLMGPEKSASCLHLACGGLCGNKFAPLDVIHLMLKIGGKDLVLKSKSNGDTVLHSVVLQYCVHSGSKRFADMMHLLVKFGGKDLIKVRNNQGYTALNFACTDTSYAGTSSSSSTCIDFLLKHAGPDLIVRDGQDAFRRLFENSNVPKHKAENLKIFFNHAMSSIEKTSLANGLLHRDIKELKNENNKMNDLLSEKNNEIDVLCNELRDREDYILDLENSIGEQEDGKTSLKNKMCNMEAQLKELQMEIQRRDADYKDLQSVLKDKEESFSKKIQSLNKDFEAEKSRYEAGLYQFRLGFIQSLEEKNKEIVKITQELEEKYDDIDIEMQLSNEECFDALADNEKLEKSVNILREELGKQDNTKKENEILQHSLGNHYKEIAKLKCVLGNNSLLQERVINENKTLKISYMELGMSFKKEVANLRSEIDSLRDDLNSSEEQKENLKASLSNSNSHVSSLKAKIEVYEHDLNVVTNSKNRLKIALRDAQNTISQLEHDIEDYKHEKEIVKIGNRKLKVCLEEKSDQVEKLVDEMEECMKDYDDLYKDFMKVKKELERERDQQPLIETIRNLAISKSEEDFDMLFQSHVDSIKKMEKADKKESAPVQLNEEDENEQMVVSPNKENKKKLSIDVKEDVHSDIDGNGHMNDTHRLASPITSPLASNQRMMNL